MSAWDDSAFMDRGKCMGSPSAGDSLHPGKSKADQEASRQFCRSGCPVVNECAWWALDNGINEGTYGGLTVADRRAINQGNLAPPARPEPLILTA